MFSSLTLFLLFFTNTQNASKKFHYRSYMVNFIVDFNCTFGDLCKDEEVQYTFNSYLNAPPANPKEPWCQWLNDATAAVNYFKSKELSEKKVKMVCEVQFLLKPYLKARKEMHLFYNIVRATSAKYLAQQFALSDVEGRPNDATLISEQSRMIQETKKDIINNNQLALYVCF